jgi:hypothetical protein
VAFQKVDPVEATATGSLLTCSITRICVKTEIGSPPILGTLPSCSYMIMLDSLSYTNLFRLGTSFGLNEVQRPKLSSLNYVSLLAPFVDISMILVSIGSVSLFLASLSFFLHSSSVALFAASFVALCYAYDVAFCSTSF